MPSARVDPHAEALRLLGEIESDWLIALAEDPMGAAEVLFEPLTVSTRPASAAGPCGVDGTYHPGPPARIVVAEDTGRQRQNFTVLHEVGHHLIEHDGPLNDLAIDDADRRDEAICNEVAASILIPADVVAELLPAGKVTGRDVAELRRHLEDRVSRAACCVAAIRRLGRPGAVMLGTPEGEAVFTAHHIATNWRVARDTAQGPDSILALAGRATSRHHRGVTTVRFAHGGSSGQLQADAYLADDGWVYAVLVDDTHSPWDTGLSFATAETGPNIEDIECPRCGPQRAWKVCPRCGDHECPNCERCSCPVGPGERRCEGDCYLMKPVTQFQGDSKICVDCE